MVKSVTIDEFLDLSGKYPILDVRSEDEFLSGHIPRAINIPILDNEQRKIVGTLYKQNGRESAIFKGLELTGPTISSRLKQGVKLIKNEKVLVHCWRGGMRSEFFAFLLHFYGLKPVLLQGGYKSFRKLVLETFQKQLNVIVLGGKTGTGKTILLEELKKAGQQVIDLEHLASHRGSSFGSLGMEPQPTQEQFENNLYTEISALDSTKVVWIEDEGRTIGDKVIPEGLWTQMKKAKKVFLNRNFEERMDRLMLDYSSFKTKDLISSMNRIGKRLGPQHVKKAIEFLEIGETRQAFEMALAYYDKAYIFNLEKNPSSNIEYIDGYGMSYSDLADLLKMKYNG